MNRLIRIAMSATTVLSLAAVAFAAGDHHDKGQHGHDHGDHTKAAKVAIGEPAPDFTLADIDGKAHKLSQYQGKFVVLEWNNPDCPFVKKHYGKGAMQALQAKYTKKDVVWLTICSSAPGKQGYYDAGEVRKKMKAANLASTAYLQDPKGEVGRMYKAKTTPHMFVIDPKGVLIYAGAIDDKPSTRTADLEGATNYVQNCLDAAMAGKPVEVKSTTPYGCSVKYAK